MQRLYDMECYLCLKNDKWMHKVIDKQVQFEKQKQCDKWIQLSKENDNSMIGGKRKEKQK